VELRLAGLDGRSGEDFHISRDVEHLDTRQGQDADRAWFGCVSYLVDPEQCRLIRRRLDSKVRGQYPIARMNPSGLPGAKQQKA
jgi:hypothetical protein